MKKKHSASRVEWEYIYHQLDAIENENIRNQVRNALEWYVIKANRYRMFEYILNTLTFIVPAVLMILNECVPDNCIAGQLVVAILGTFAAAAKSFSKLHDKRICYRRSAEFIKSETALYINRVGVYKSKDSEEIFVRNILKIRKEENDSWITIENEKKENDKKDKESSQKENFNNTIEGKQGKNMMWDK